MRMKKLKLNKKFVRDARNSLIAILNILSVIVLLRGLYILTETVNSEEYNVARPLLLVICGIFILLISNLIISYFRVSKERLLFDVQDFTRKMTSRGGGSGAREHREAQRRARSGPKTHSASYFSAFMQWGTALANAMGVEEQT